MKPGLVTFLVSFLVSFATGPWLIRVLKKLNFGQTIQEEGPQSHASKAGTPTMGGVIILLGFLAGVGVAILYWVGGAFDSYFRMTALDLGQFVAVILLILTYAAIGAVDDWLTAHPRDGRRGISSKPKFLLQLAAAIGFVTYLQVTHGLIRVDAFGVPVWLYAPFAVLFITGMANFVNITDGLDGLASGLSIVLFSALGLSVRGGWALDLVPMAFAGACVGFLWYNFNPARVFMGDTGALAIGVAIPAIAIVTRSEVFVIIAGMVFILDGLSSALQWAVFKYTRIRSGTGKRVFKMSPVHHHFELSGWPEQLVVVRFWIVGGLCAFLAFLLEFWR